ncbi:MAG: LD-carboxypeptidase [Lentisphaeria bacterium]|jgi:muramoyltetrapeptide carboxypeptidase
MPAAPASAFPNPFPPEIRTVGVFAPAGRVPDPALLDAGLRQLQRWGLAVVEGRHLRSSHRNLAGTDAERCADLAELLQNPRVDLLLAARGGFGCARLLDGLPPTLLQAFPKPLLGYSDLTALHLARFARGVTTGLAGPMAAVELARGEQPGPDAAALTFTFAAGRRAWAPARPATLPPGTRLATLKPGTARGPLLPVNLTVLCSLLGTPHLPDLAGALLALEDVNEPVYRLDRCLTQLRQAGVTPRLAGVLLGDFSGTDEPAWLEALLAEFAATVNGPVVSGLPWGHCLPQLTLPVGRPAELAAPPAGPASLAWE